MPRALAVWMALCLATCVSQAAAESDQTPRPGERGGSRFSLGAGFGFTYEVGTGAGLSGLGLLSSGNVSVVTPMGSALVELAVSRQLRLIASVQGGYSRQTAEATNDEAMRLSDGTTTRWTTGGALGARWVLNPDGVVEVSPALLLGIHGGSTKNSYVGTSTWADGEAHDLRATSDALGYDARLGLVLERLLLASLYLRFDVYFLRLGYDRSSSELVGQEAGPARSKRREYNVAYGFSPFLQLRLAF